MQPIDISYFCKTKSQANDFSARIGSVLGKLYITGFNLETVLLDEFGIQKKDKFMTLLQDNQVAITSSTALKDFLSKLQEMISALPVLELQLAFEPKEATLSALSGWFALNTKKQVLFQITVHPEMIAGVSISYTGRHMDFSIKKQFEEVVKVILTPAPTTQPPPTTHQDLNTMHLGR